MRKKKEQIKDFQYEKSKRKERFTRKDWFCLGIIIVLFSIVAFYNLGSTHIPNSGWKPEEKGESVILEIEDHPIDKIYYFLGTENNPNARSEEDVFLIEASDDLEIDSFLLENLEEGNVRAFRDVLGMKDKIKAYAKYLGLDPEEIADEFNDFLFEHTSKISLSDILAVEKEKNKGKEETVKKMSSPYTIVKQKKLNVKPILYVVLGFFLFIMLILLIFNILRPKEEIRTNELLGLGREGELCELAY